MSGFSSELLLWYEQNKRDLPWRHTSDPYKIWLSEIILQQTRVDQGLSYYFRFIELFPGIRDLANATEEMVLKAWQGLGYYSRARNLHYTAGVIVSEYGGIFPDSYEKLLALKGIGPYTAAAVASFAYNEKVPAIDGNVIRVISRLFGIETAFDSGEGKKMIRQIADELIDDARPGLFNQAMMEFGATLCTPARPRCTECPFQSGCVALRKDMVLKLPVKKSKTKVRDLWIYYLVAETGDHVYLKKRAENDIWKGLHDFIELRSETELTHDQVLSAFKLMLGLDFSVTSVSSEMIHLLSHRKIRAKFIRANLTDQIIAFEKPYFSVAAEKVIDYSMPKLIEKYWKARETL